MKNEKKYAKGVLRGTLCLILTLSAVGLSACVFPSQKESSSQSQSASQSTEQTNSGEESSSEVSGGTSGEITEETESASSSFIPPRDDNELPILPLP